MTKITATANHLLLSIVIFSLLFGILIFFWYPSPYFSASGGWEGLKIAAAVDLVLGPILTLVVFNTKKSKKILVADLSVIVLIQLFALVWGMHTIYQQRPVASVFWLGSFLTVTAEDLSGQDDDLTMLKKMGKQSPPLIHIQDSVSEQKFYQSGQYAGTGVAISPFYRLDLYRPLQEHFAEMEKFQLDIHHLVKNNELLKLKIIAKLAEKNKQIDDFQYYKLISKYNNIILIFDNNAEVVGHIVIPLPSEK